MSGFEYRRRIRQVGTRGGADTVNLCSQGIGDVVAVQVQRYYCRVLGRMQQDPLQEGVNSRVSDDGFLTRLRVLELAPQAAVNQLGAKFLLYQRVGPVMEAIFREFHDAALAHDCD